MKIELALFVLNATTALTQRENRPWRRKGRKGWRFRWGLRLDGEQGMVFQMGFESGWGETGGVSGGV